MSELVLAERRGPVLVLTLNRPERLNSWTDALEFGHGARTVDELSSDDRRYDRISEWGHQPIQSPIHLS